MVPALLHPPRPSPLLAAGLAAGLLAAAAVIGAAPVQAQVTPEPLPTQLVCHPSDRLTASVSRDASGAPLAAGIYATSGTHECEARTQGAASVQPDGSTRFEWADDAQGGKRYRATVRRVGADGYTLALQPPACGTLALPASISLSANGKGCKTAVDRDAAFVLFWRQLKDAVNRRDGELLQRLALPQLEFSPDAGTVKAPAAVLRDAAACLPGIVSAESGTDLGQLLAATDTPQPDRPPLARVDGQRISAGAFSAKWTARGWRLEWFNTSPAVFSGCKPR